MKCKCCGQAIPEPQIGNIVEVGNGGISANYTGLAVVTGYKTPYVGQRTFDVVFITGKHAGTSVGMELARITIVHGYIHVDRSYDLGNGDAVAGGTQSRY